MGERRLIPINERFADIARELIANSHQPQHITPDTVFQQRNRTNTRLVDRTLEELVLPGSGILNLEHVEELYQAAKEGTSCLILMEHYSNFDLPAFFYLLEQSGKPEIATSLVAIAGMKLNEQSAFVRAFTEAYTRLVIYPSRSLDSLPESEATDERRKKANEINMAATRTMIRLKHTGSIVLVFPTGTRYRPGRPETKQAVKEIDSYVKMFDLVVFVGVAGNVLLVNPDEDMSHDYPVEDVILFNVDKPRSCAEFREQVRAEARPGADPKRAVGDAIMARLEELHIDTEAVRSERIRNVASTLER